MVRQVGRGGGVGRGRSLITEAMSLMFTELEVGGRVSWRGWSFSFGEQCERGDGPKRGMQVYAAYCDGAIW